jgi:hypothetical protein
MMLAVSRVATAGMFGGAAKEEDLAGIQRMAVATLLGDSFHVIHIGTTAFQNKYYAAPVPLWQMNAKVSDEVVRTMGLRGRFPAVALALGDVAVESLYRKPTDAEISPDGLHVLMEAARHLGVEALLVIQKTSGGENAPFHQPGFGLFQHSMFRLSMQCTYSSFRATVYQSNTGRIVAHGWHEPCSSGLEKLPWKPRWDQFTAEEQSTFESSLRNQLLGTVDLMLDEMHLLKP